jgi:hypothetical protein
VRKKIKGKRLSRKFEQVKERPIEIIQCEKYKEKRRKIYEQALRDV